MSIERMTSVWKLSREKGAGLLILLSLADRADDDGFCWPGMDDTARRARVTRRYVLTVVERAIETGELFVNKRAGYTHQYIVPHGLTIEQLRGTMKRRFDWSDDEIKQALNILLSGCELCSHVNPSSQGGVNPSSQGGVNPSSHESSFNHHKETSLSDFPFAEDTPDEIMGPSEYSRLNTAFLNAFKLPLDDGPKWVSAINELVAIGAQPAHIDSAAEIFAKKNYACKGPWSILVTVRNLMIADDRKKETNTQKIGGAWG